MIIDLTTCKYFLILWNGFNKFKYISQMNNNEIKGTKKMFNNNWSKNYLNKSWINSILNSSFM
jgi:hypothetical protein